MPAPTNRADNEWRELVRNHLLISERGPEFEDFGRRLAIEASLTDIGRSFALKLKENYKAGRSLSIPDDEGWLLGPEHFLNEDVELGAFEDPLVMAVVAARDPSSVMSLAATARLAPRAARRQLIEGIVCEVGRETQHEEVRECVDYAASHHFSRNAVREVKEHVKARVGEVRDECLFALRDILRDLLEQKLDPSDFVEGFFDLSERNRIKMDVYRSMVMTLIESQKVRPLVKLLMVKGLNRMPRRVQAQVIGSIRTMPNNPETIYVKRELGFVVADGGTSPHYDA